MTTYAPLATSGYQLRGVASQKDETIEEVTARATRRFLSDAPRQIATGSDRNAVISAPVDAPLDDENRPWVGLEYVQQFGLPGYPPPRLAGRGIGGPQSLPDGDPKKEAWRENVRRSKGLPHRWDRPLVRVPNPILKTDAGLNRCHAAKGNALPALVQCAFQTERGKDLCGKHRKIAERNGEAAS